MADKKVREELLDVGDDVSVKKTVLVGVVKSLAVQEGKIAYLVEYEDDGETHERFFKRSELVVKEKKDE